MKYVVTSTLLYGRLQMLDRVVNPKNTAPILQCFLFKAHGDNLMITATDNDTTINTTVPLTQGDSDTSFAIPAKQIMDILKEIPEQPLTIEFNPNTYQINLRYQNGHFLLQGENGDDFPQQKDPEGESHEITVSAPLLSKAFASAIVAASDDENRKVMNSIFVDITPQDLSVVASDGHKLVCYKILCDTHDTTASFILPRKPSALLRSIIDKEEGNITLCTWSSGAARINTDSFSMSCLLLMEKYPNYKNVIPQNNTNIATIDKETLQSAVKRVLVASDKATSLVKLNCEVGKITLSTENLSFAQSAEEQVVCQYEGMPLRIGFRGDYLLDLLSNVTSTNVLIKLSDPSRAGLILPAEQDKDTDLTMLLMPLLITA